MPCSHASLLLNFLPSSLCSPQDEIFQAVSEWSYKDISLVSELADASFSVLKGMVDAGRAPAACGDSFNRSELAEGFGCRGTDAALICWLGSCVLRCLQLSAHWSYAWLGVGQHAARMLTLLLSWKCIVGSRPHMICSCFMQR